MDKNYKPKIRNDIFYSDAYLQRNDGYWVVGSEGNDCQLIIKNEKINSFKRLFSIMDGEHTIEQMEEMKFGSSVELIRVVESIEAKGLLEGSDNKEEFNELERLSIKLWRYDFHSYTEHTQKICCYLITIFKILCILVVGFTLFCILNKYYLLKTLTILKAIQYKDNSLKSIILGYLLIIVGTYLLFFFHEGAHSIVAIKNKVRPHYVACVLYLGFLPMCYVKIKNIYTLKKRQIYSILLAGITVNLILCLIFMDFYLLTENELCKLFAVSNFKMFYMNLIPISLTDGYFIMGLLFATPNTRMNFYKMLAFPKLIFKNSKKMVMLFVVNFTTILVALNFEIYILWNVLKLSQYYMQLKFLIIDIFYIYVLHLVNRLKFRKMKI